MVDGGQLREGKEPQSAGSSEESDAGMVPKKPAKTWVTPVESVEGRAAAEGKSAPRKRAPGTGPGNARPRKWSGSDSERREGEGSGSTTC